jgi:hypothetical protein
MVISPLRLTLVVLAGAVVGAVAGAGAGYATALSRLRNATLVYVSLSYLIDGSNAAMDVRAARALRAGDSAKGISILEGKIDQSLLHLADYEKLVPPDQRERAFYDDISVIRAYRADVPSSSTNAEVQATMNRALNLRFPARERQ